MTYRGPSLASTCLPLARRFGRACRPDWLARRVLYASASPALPRFARLWVRLCLKFVSRQHRVAIANPSQPVWPCNYKAANWSSAGHAAYQRLTAFGGEAQLIVADVIRQYRWSWVELTGCWTDQCQLLVGCHIQFSFARRFDDREYMISGTTILFHCANCCLTMPCWRIPLIPQRIYQGCRLGNVRLPQPQHSHVRHKSRKDNTST